MRKTEEKRNIGKVKEMKVERNTRSKRVKFSQTKEKKKWKY